MGVLTGGEIQALGLQGLESPAVGGALLTEIASAVGVMFAWLTTLGRAGGDGVS